MTIENSKKIRERELPKQSIFALYAGLFVTFVSTLAFIGQFLGSGNQRILAVLGVVYVVLFGAAFVLWHRHLIPRFFSVWIVPGGVLLSSISLAWLYISAFVLRL